MDNTYPDVGSGYSRADVSSLALAGHRSSSDLEQTTRQRRLLDWNDRKIGCRLNAWYHHNNASWAANVHLCILVQRQLLCKCDEQRSDLWRFLHERLVVAKWCVKQSVQRHQQHLQLRIQPQQLPRVHQDCRRADQHLPLWKQIRYCQCRLLQYIPSSYGMECHYNQPTDHKPELTCLWFHDKLNQSPGLSPLLDSRRWHLWLGNSCRLRVH